MFHLNSTRLHTLLYKVLNLNFTNNFSERELMFTTDVDVRPSVVCRLSVTFVHPTQRIENFGI